VCKLLDHSCDQDLLSDDEMELLVEKSGRQVPTIIQRRKKESTREKNPFQDDLELGLGLNDNDDDDDDDDDNSDSFSNRRDSIPLGAGCLPCTPKSLRKTTANLIVSCTNTPKSLRKTPKKTTPVTLCSKHGGEKSSNWCCGVVATVKKTAKKL
jgi:hypothetical protein